MTWFSAFLLSCVCSCSDILNLIDNIIFMILYYSFGINTGLNPPEWIFLRYEALQNFEINILERNYVFFTCIHDDKSSHCKFETTLVFITFYVKQFFPEQKVIISIKNQRQGSEIDQGIKLRQKDEGSLEF